MRLTPKKDDAHLFVSKSNVFDTAASWEKLHPDHVTEIKFVSDVHRIISVHDRKNGQLHGYIRIRDWHTLAGERDMMTTLDKDLATKFTVKMKADSYERRYLNCRCVVDTISNDGESFNIVETYRMFSGDLEVFNGYILMND